MCRQHGLHGEPSGRWLVLRGRTSGFFGVGGFMGYKGSDTVGARSLPLHCLARGCLMPRSAALHGEAPPHPGAVLLDLPGSEAST
jgi:hypothetical protein